MVDRVTFAPEPTGANAPEPEVDPNRPAWLDPKFETPEAQAQAYAELQAKATRDAQELARLKGTPPGEPAPSDPSGTGDGQPPAGSEKPKDPNAATDEAAKELADKAGIDLNPYSQEFATTGDVKPESRAKIVEALSGLEAFKGHDVAAIVNDFIAGKQALVNNDRAMVMEAAGGEESYTRMVEWASTSLPPEQVDVYNRQVESGDRHATLFAVEGLRAKYEAAVGRDPRLLKGTGIPAATGAAYRSVAEWQRDVRDPKYKSDPSFRDEVQRRLAMSNI